MVVSAGVPVTPQSPLCSWQGRPLANGEVSLPGWLEGRSPRGGPTLRRSALSGQPSEARGHVGLRQSHNFPALGNGKGPGDPSPEARARRGKRRSTPTGPRAARAGPGPAPEGSQQGAEGEAGGVPHRGPGLQEGREGVLREAGGGGGQGAQDARIGRRSLSVLLPLLGAVAATSQAAADVAGTVSAAEVAAAPTLDLRPQLEAPAPEGPAPGAAPPLSTVRLSILSGSTLGVSFYPDFGYNPEGGGGEGRVVDLGDGRVSVEFDPRSLYIPPLSFDSTTFVGLPLPPPLKIQIVPSLLKGIVDRRTGRVDLAFKSQFFFTAGPIYRAPPLSVEAVLTTEGATGELREGHGTRLDRNGRGTLVAVAVVPPVRDAFLDRFLGLPTDVLAVLPAQFCFDC